MPLIDGKQIRDATIALTKLATDAAQAIANKLPLAGGTMTGDIDLNNAARIINVPAPQLPSHVARLADIHATPWKDRVVCATTGNMSGYANGSFQAIPAAGLTDGQAVAIGDRLLVRAQTNAWENGIYFVSSGSTVVRAADSDSLAELRGAVVTVEKGALYADHRFAQNQDWAAGAVIGASDGSANIQWVDIGVGTPAGFLTRENKDMPGLPTTANHQKITAAPIAFKPAQGSYVRVFLNGVPMSLCDGPSDANKDVYFAPASGLANARAINAIAPGDFCWWNGATPNGFQISATDIVDFDYLIVL